MSHSYSKLTGTRKSTSNFPSMGALHLMFFFSLQHAPCNIISILRSRSSNCVITNGRVYHITVGTCQEVGALVHLKILKQPHSLIIKKIFTCQSSSCHMPLPLDLGFRFQINQIFTTCLYPLPRTHQRNPTGSITHSLRLIKRESPVIK